MKDLSSKIKIIETKLEKAKQAALDADARVVELNKQLKELKILNADYNKQMKALEAEIMKKYDQQMKELEAGIAKNKRGRPAKKPETLQADTGNPGPSEKEVISGQDLTIVEIEVE